MTEIILASASPRRKELLERMHLPFTILTSDLEEDVTNVGPADTVLALSMQKASDVAEKIISMPEHGDDILIIGADTVVALEEDILGKPVDEADACRMIGKLAGRDHDVYTGVTLLHMINGKENIHAFYEKTTVSVAPMTMDEIKAYVAEGESLDKAGAYGIQGSFCRFISGISGDYHNVVGLPVAALYKELKKVL